MECPEPRKAMECFNCGEEGQVNRSSRCFMLTPFTATPRRSAPSLVCSKVPVVSVTRRAIRLLNARKDPLMCARIAKWKVRKIPMCLPLTQNSELNLCSIGHKTLDCTENRKFDLNNIPDKLPEEAWSVLKKASDEKDLEDFREVRGHRASWAIQIWLTMNRVSKFTPRRFLLLLSWISRRKCAKRTSSFTSSLWSVTTHLVEWLRP